LEGAKDLFDLELFGHDCYFRTSHVIPALIKKCIETKEQDSYEIVVWGTDSASREFLYIDECAEAIVLASKKYNKSEPVNIGSEMEISVKDLT
jgi:GDP-L-fucose synthase